LEKAKAKATADAKSKALSLASTPPTNSSGTPVVADEAGSLGMTVFLFQH
jgi:hypothetical protein